MATAIPTRPTTWTVWKRYTQWDPDGHGFLLTDAQTGVPFIEKAGKLGIKMICIHKGIPFRRKFYEHSLWTDIGEAVARNPEVNFWFAMPAPCRVKRKALRSNAWRRRG
ncbi:MAG: hypothetical protein ACU84Q_18760 [Gammaproteobacteria bacterium]